MANTTQIRLQAITGSLVDITSGITSIAAQTAVGSLSASDIPDGEALLRYYAQAISNVHGQTAFGSNEPGRYVYNSGNGIKKLFPDTDAKIVLGGATLPSMSSVSGFAGSNITDSSLLDSTTTISLDGGSTFTLVADGHIRFLNSDSKSIVYRLTSPLGSGDSSMAVVYVPEVSDLASLSVSAISTIDATTVALTGLEWLRVRAQEVTADSNLKLNAGAAVDMDGASLDADFTGAFDLQAGASSEIGMSDGVLTLDLNGTDVVDGLLVDAEGSITLQAAHSSDGAMILNAEGSSGVIQLQQQGAAKLLVSGSEVRSNTVLRVIDGTDSSSTTTGAVQVTGGIGIGGKMFLGGDLDGAGDVNFDKSNVAISIGAGAHQLAEDSSGLKLAAVGSSKKAVLSSAQADIEVKGGASGTGGVVLSGSSGVEFVADGGFSFTGHSANSGILLMDAATEAVTYRSNFSASTSIMAAINSLKAQGEPTLFRRVHSGADIAAGSAVALTKVGGDATNFSGAIAPHQAEVYVNGQLLMSGSESARAAGTADYAISGTDQLKFGFSIVDGDVVNLMDRS